MNFSFKKHILPRIHDLIIDSVISQKDELNKQNWPNAFELFGFDFLIDEDFRTWILEVNTNPFLGIPNEFIRKLMPVMVSDMM